MMKLKNIAPWNWFKHENDNRTRNLPATYEEGASAHPLAPLHREVDRLFNDFFSRNGPSFPAGFDRASGDGALFRPMLDISESGNKYKIKVEVPGAEKDDIHVEVQDDRLVIRGEKKREEEDEKDDFHRVERFYGSFQRILDLPPDADANEIKARFRHGVLTLTVPRTGEKPAGGKTIAIE